MRPGALGAARAWLERFLASELDGLALEVAAREDALFSVVATVEAGDPAGLRALLEDAAYDLGRRRAVLRELSGPLRHHLRHLRG